MTLVLPSFLFSLKKILDFLNRYPYISAFSLGFLLNFALPPFGFWVVLPLSLSPFLNLIETLSTFKRTLFGCFFYFFGYFFGGLYWIGIALSVDWSRFFWVLPFSCLGIPIALAGMVAPVLSLFWFFKKKKLLSIFLFIGLLFVSELIRTYIFPKFPWNLIGYTLASSSWFLQFSAFGGIFGLTLLSLFLGSLPYLLKKPETRFSGIILGLLLIGIFLAGGLRLWNTPAFLTDISLRLVQPNIPQTLKWNSKYRERILHTLLSLSNSSSKQDPFVIIWPETAVSFFLDEESDLRKKIASTFQESSLIVIGSARRITSLSEKLSFLKMPPSLLTKEAWNSLFIVGKKGEIYDYYDKVQLVPFGEYLPFRKLLGFLGLTQLINRTIDFSEGKGLKNISLPSIPSFSPLICYEIAFPHAVLNTTLPRPDWILNITNDAWFGISTGPYQHLQMAQVRACEEGLPVVRVANTGVSAIIDPCGRLLMSLPLNTLGFMDGNLPKALKPPFYALYGNWIPIFFFFSLGLLLTTLQWIKDSVKKKKDLYT